MEVTAAERTTIYTNISPLAQRVNNYIQTQHSSIAAVAKDIGYSRTTVSRYLTGKYDSNPNDLESKLTDFLTRQTGEAVDLTTPLAKSEGKTWQTPVFFESRDAKAVLGVCQSCQEYIGLGIVVARSGYGKTYALRQYAKLSRVAYIECDDTMSMEIIQSAATELLVNVALAVLALAGAYAVYYIRLGTSKLKAQTAQIEDASTRKVLDDALEDVANLATLSVGAMEQTTAKALREAVKGGKASREELVALGKQVFDEVKASIAPEAQRVITKNLGSFDEYLTKCIEAAVLEIKQNEPYITLPESALIEGEAER